MISLGKKKIMSEEKKQLNKEQLEKVTGGVDTPDNYVDVKCIITYIYQAKESTDIVTLKLKVIDNKASESDAEDAVKNWCTINAYEYVGYQILASDNFFVV